MDWGTIVAALLALIGVVITNVVSSNSVKAQIASNQTLINHKIEELTEQVKDLTKYTKLIPVLEYRLEQSEKEIDSIKERLKHCERSRADENDK